MDDYEHSVFRQWAASDNPQDRESLHAKYQATRELRQYIKNKCEGIVSGSI